MKQRIRYRLLAKAVTVQAIDIPQKPVIHFGIKLSRKWNPFGMTPLPRSHKFPQDIVGRIHLGLNVAGTRPKVLIWLSTFASRPLLPGGP
jgi:hypothetical protein